MKKGKPIKADIGGDANTYHKDSIKGVRNDFTCLKALVISGGPRATNAAKQVDR